MVVAAIGAEALSVVETLEDCSFLLPTPAPFIDKSYYYPFLSLLAGEFIYSYYIGSLV